MPQVYVRPFVRRNKTDRADAEALVDAARADRIPAAPVKRVEQQALIGLHRVREQWVTTRTARINTLRGLLREHGVAGALGDAAPAAGPVEEVVATPAGEPAASERVARDDVRRRPGEVFRDCAECPEMVVLAGGRLALGHYEDTVGEYRAFASATGRNAGGGCRSEGFDGDSVFGCGRRRIAIRCCA